MMAERSTIPRMVAAVLALLGLLDALYLSLERLTGGVLVCPVGAGGCEAVQASAYSAVLGVPVAFIGVAGYLALLALALLALNTDHVAGLPAPLLLLAVASLGVLFSAYLTYLQVAVIGAVCFWCVVSALFQLGIWVCALLDWRAWRAGQAAPQQAGAGASRQEAA
jgi:uncharacterized membrane protein